jgi:hypothetical protein
MKFYSADIEMLMSGWNILYLLRCISGPKIRHELSLHDKDGVRFHTVHFRLGLKPCQEMLFFDPRPPSVIDGQNPGDNNCTECVCL